MTSGDGSRKDPGCLAKELGLEVIENIPLLHLPSIDLIPYTTARQLLVLPVRENDTTVTLAVADPLDLDAIESVRYRVKKQVETVVAAKETLLIAIEKIYQAQSSGEEGKEDGIQEYKEENLVDLLDEKAQSGGKTGQILSLILREAIRQRASDIHFEPFAGHLRIRFRIDGCLHGRDFAARGIEPALITRIKVMAQMDIAERRLPQDGRIKVSFGGREIDFRVSSVPVSDGERLVLRILDKGNVRLGIDEIGMSVSVTESFKELTSCKEGIILVTGPTGSGKTTTLYSALSQMDLESVNIMTVEDPVEYKLSRIAQIAVRPSIGLTFSKGLRHILRQDPDVIMLGEIRDSETAQIAIQASLTGHLVLSTLHTNDAPSAVTRLVDMGIEPYLISASVIGVVAQRLVRKVCPHCCQKSSPSQKTLEQMGITESESCDFMQAVGCEECFGSGYKGRHGIYELMGANEKMRHLISTGADLDAVHKLALQQGMVPLREHGIELARKGITTLEEVLRMTRAGEIT